MSAKKQASDIDQVADLIENLDHVLGSSIFGAAYLDRELNYVWINSAYARICNQDRLFLKGKNHFDLFSGSEMRAVFQKVIDTGTPQYSMASPFALPGSSERGMMYWNWSAQPVRRKSGEVIGLLLTAADVTEQKLAELAAQENQALFAQLFESSPDASLLVQEDGAILAANRQAEILFGYERSAMLELNIDRLIQDENPSLPIRPLLYRAQSESFADTAQKFFGVRKNHRKFPVEIILNSITIAGRPLQICVLRDVTRRVRAEQALKEQTEFVRLLQDVAVAANEAETVEGALQFALDRICQFTGWPVGHAILADSNGVLVSTGLWYIDNLEKRSLFQQVSESMHWDAENGGIPYRILISGQAQWVADVMDDPDFRRKEQAYRSGLRTSFSFPIRIGKDVAGVLEFFSENTVIPHENILQIMPHIGTQLGRVVERERGRQALLRSESRFRAIFEASIIGIQVVDPEGHFVQSNPAVQSMLGYNQDDLSQIKQNEILYAEDASKNWELLKSLLRGERDHYQLETRFIRKDGSLMWAHLTVSLMGPQSLPPQYVIALIIDITERKRMEAELAEVQSRLQDSIESERLRLAMELHDGPLQDLYGAIFQIQEIVPNLSDTVTLTSVRNAQSIVQQVISSLRNTVGDLRPPTLIPFGLEKAIRSHMDRWQQIYPGLNIHLELMSDGTSLTASARLALFRAYQQLISNVARHSNATNMWVRLKMLPGEVVLEVQDDGIGFNLPARWVELAREGHTGLVGISERLDTFGGNLWVDTSAQKGTLVRITIPRERIST